MTTPFVTHTPSPLSIAIRNKPSRPYRIIAALLVASALILPGTGYANVITFTHDHWTPGANPFQTPINPFQAWSFDLHAFVQANPNAEIESATLTIDAWDFDTSFSATNRTSGSDSAGFVYDTYFSSNYDFATHQGTLFDPTWLDDIAYVEGNGSHILDYPHGGPDGGLVLDLNPGANAFSYLWDGSLDVSLDFNENAWWSETTWSLTRPDPNGNPWTVTDWHRDYIASGQPGHFGLGDAVLTINYVVPEPASLSLLAIGLAGFACRRLRRKF